MPLTETITPNLHRILSHPSDNNAIWKADLQRLMDGDMTLDRRAVDENTVKAIQRLLIFLGYSTATTGAFIVDGDFGRGTNRAVAQFQYEHGLNDKIKRSDLCYPCSWQTARYRIRQIPDVRLDLPTTIKLVEVANDLHVRGDIMCGSFEEAMFHLNSLHEHKYYSCRVIRDRYGAAAKKAADTVELDTGHHINPKWILSIIKQETAGVVRPRFEQHWLSRLYRRNPEENFTEQRFQAMSFGLGQVMGINFKRVGASSARQMFTSPLEEQVYHVACFLTDTSRSMRQAVAVDRPGSQHFHIVGRRYNGPRYARHHYHERLQRWFREFDRLEKLENE